MAAILTTYGNLTYATTKHAVVGIAQWMSVTYPKHGWFIFAIKVTLEAFDHGVTVWVNFHR